jgi:hypothetical protein
MLLAFGVFGFLGVADAFFGDAILLGEADLRARPRAVAGVGGAKASCGIKNFGGGVMVLGELSFAGFTSICSLSNSALIHGVI